jgi:hypothetical protein
MTLTYCQYGTGVIVIQNVKASAFATAVGRSQLELEHQASCVMVVM